MDRLIASLGKLIFFFFFFHLILLSPSIFSIALASHHGEHREKQIKPSPGQRITSTIVQIRANSWDKIKSYIYRMHEKLLPPTLDFRSRGDQSVIGEESVGTKERIKKAAQKSLETSEAAFEETAETVAIVVEEAMEKTKKKVKERVSIKAEL
ncbi:hypothetical protein Dimus_017479 [Dionaea muscipula]